ncbi:hypothetical protein F4779DRAFT_608328 [Xylariaceae sp. FL0662B]|nr:hypothetical protein F4779DRAFT_608328 [Xylariaceae sp. FL0662B]
MDSREMERHDQESLRHLLSDEKLAHDPSDEDGASSDSYQSSWNKASSISSFGRRLRHKHYYFLGLALVLIITLFLANPYHPIMSLRRPQSNKDGSDPNQHVISISLSPSGTSTITQQVTSIPEPPKKPGDDLPKTPADKPADGPVDKPSHETADEKPASQDKDTPKDKDAPKDNAQNLDQTAEQQKKPAEGEAAEPPAEEPKEEPEETTNKPNADIHWCTTWPVDAEGHYTPRPKPASNLRLDSFAPEGGWKKPEGIKIVAMVFYGRRRNVDILDCYLRQNLVTYGGYLDEVRFMVHTTIKDDVKWLRKFVQEEEEYKFVDLGACTKEEYGCIWELATDDDTIYLKIDDDILYIHHDAIPQLIHTRLAQPHPYAVSAQLVNSPVTGIQQYHYGAIHPFLPDPKPRNYREPSVTWRPSESGLYAPATRPLDGNPLDLEPPYQGHPWILLSNSSHETQALERTPMGAYNRNPGGEDIAFAPTWKSWAAAAQQLYSLLYNLELNEMDRYHFGRRIDYRDAHERATSTYRGPGGEQLFDMQYVRYNLNFMAIWGRDVRAGLPIHDDELEFTAEIPARLHRPFVIDTRAVVAHQSFYTQSKGVGSTDLMDRWRAFANENVCAADNQKVPFDPPCERR